MKNKRWDERIFHLQIAESDDEHPLIKAFEISGIPFIAIINREMRVDYSGQPSKVKVE